MKKYVNLLLALQFLITPSSFAQRAPGGQHRLQFNPQSLREVPSEFEGDILYFQSSPLFGVNSLRSDARQEFYFSTETPESNTEAKMQWLKNLIQEEKEITGDVRFNIEVIGQENLENDPDIREIINHFESLAPHTEYSILPSDLMPETEERSPQSVRERLIWALVRTGASTSASTLSLTILKDESNGDGPLPMALALAVSAIVGVGSGSVTFFSSPYEHFLERSTWTQSFMSSDNILARNFREFYKITDKRIARFLQMNFSRYFPRGNAELAEQLNEISRGLDETPHRTRLQARNRLYSLVRNTERFGRWFLIEYLFNLILITLPHQYAGITPLNDFNDYFSEIGNITLSSAMATATQGLAEGSVFRSQRTLVEDLQREVLNRIRRESRTPTAREVSLLRETEMLLSDAPEHQNYRINRNSVPELRNIGTRTSKLLTLISFFSVMGVVAGEEAGLAILVGVGVGGAVYHARLSGAFDRVSLRSRRRVPLAELQIPTGIDWRLLPFDLRMCSVPFLP